MTQVDPQEVQRHWGKENTTIRDKVADTLRGRPALLESAALILQALPVTSQTAQEKKGLVHDLMAASKQWEALLRRVDLLSARLKRMPVVNVLSKQDAPAAARASSLERLERLAKALKVKPGELLE